jgi:hypothetical protein
VPTLLQCYQAATQGIEFNYLTLGLLTMGCRHSGTFTSKKGGVQFAVVAMDYFTKWAKVEALVNITAKSIEWFLWKSVVCHYGILYAFVMDNGKQFDYDLFQEWCANLHIRNYYSSPGHPQANREVEATHKTIFKILKKKLSDHKGDWAKDLQEVLWTY